LVRVASLTEPISGMMRSALLNAADSRSLQRFMYRHGMSLGARRFVAGETLDEFLRVVRSVNDRGFVVAAGLLGEGIQAERDAASVVHEYQHILRRIANLNLQSNIALKLTHLGLGIGQTLALDNVRTIADEAKLLGNFVRMDMEQSAYTEATLSIYRQLRDEGRTNVGTVLQAYLRRSEADLRALLPLAPNLRLVKGAYLEPAEIAFPKKADVDRNYLSLIEIALSSPGFTAIATHDDAIIEKTIAIVNKGGLLPERFEFQMLYGVRPKLQEQLRDRGYRVRLAIPFGSQWYPYLMRRLAERPANLFFFLGTLWRR
jgi:proline dehydrogenase